MNGVSTLDRPPQSVAPTRYTVGLASDEDDVRAAQRLRHDVFAGEMGALLSTRSPASTWTASTPTATTCSSATP